MEDTNSTNVPAHGSPARIAVAGFKVFITYMCFGLAFEAMLIIHCLYRAQTENPSDLPCLHPLWVSIGLVGSLTMWPLIALGFVISVQSLLFKAVGAAWLLTFAAVLAWIFRRRHA
jgi:hypothetical protein